MLRPTMNITDLLRSVGLRPTKQRLWLGKLLFDGRDRHMSAEQLHKEAQEGGIHVSLATVYNTLHQFTEAGLLREIVVDPGRSYFDTNTTDHHHFYYEESGRLEDIPGEQVQIQSLPVAPEGYTVKRVDVIVRIDA